MKTKHLRRLSMGLQTVLGGRPMGFFTPYRYAAEVRAPARYDALEVLFHAAEPRMAEVLDDIDAAAEELLAFQGPPPRPRWDQTWFPRLDGAAAYVITRRSAPSRIIEVGSGHSTRMLAASAPGECRITCIDPQPRADISALDVEIEARVLAPGDADLFARLEPGDVAFFDSSHVLWPGSDVDMISNRILPVLKPGVLIHIHDILLPDPYPQEWAWRGYTEQNVLAGWLHGACEIVFSSHYALTRMAGAGRPGVKNLPLPGGALETSLWLQRC